MHEPCMFHNLWRRVHTSALWGLSQYIPKCLTVAKPTIRKLLPVEPQNICNRMESPRTDTDSFVSPSATWRRVWVIRQRSKCPEEEARTWERGNNRRLEKIARGT
jgi:hypothetical protein